MKKFNYLVFFFLDATDTRIASEIKEIMNSNGFESQIETWDRYKKELPNGVYVLNTDDNLLINAVRVKEEVLKLILGLISNKSKSLIVIEYNNNSLSLSLPI